ncbi:hypothetical protein [Mammaliicoccus sp. H-M33]|uniref:hypothetical protein n=1 Tax=Mammaliicoccus sp. H-M33 TaxID=2898692 RepID=UPI001EFB61A3|nr:hypothetical protein [Mammaliicoccus sp. H-M33]
MAYKHEETHKQILSSYHAYLGDDAGQKEIEEVYAKAKVWDKYIADVERNIRNISSNEDEIKWHIDYKINEYLEDNNDDKNN